MKIWIDLANSPHVLFFAPLIAELERRGHQLSVTARECAQTIPLCRLHALNAVEVGRHGGRSVLGKAWSMASRALDLRAWAVPVSADLAVSHNSYAHCMAAKSLGIPYVTIMDYEHTPANHINFRLADRILLPSVLTSRSVRKYGARREQVVLYEGFKEQVYLEGFQPNGLFLDGVISREVQSQFIVVVARPPADYAIYHRFENPLFWIWLKTAAREETIRIVVLPRTEEQRAHVLQMHLPGVVVLPSAVPAPDLIASADLVVSAGGTMNREAAVLGVPAYSLFAGRKGQVDQSLENMGRLTFVGNEGELGKIIMRKKGHPEPLRNPGLRSKMVDYILGTVSSPRV